MSDTIERDVYSVDEFCARNDICRVTFYKMVKHDGLPTIKYGTRRLVPKKAFEQWQKARITINKQEAR